MRKEFFRKAYELILKEIQTFLSLSYLLMIGIGMLFNYQKYSEFGINIFQYADIFDFLIAPFEDYIIFVFATFSILISLSLALLDFYWKNRFPKFYSMFNFGLDKKPWFHIYRVLTYALLLAFYVYISADLYGSFSKKRTENRPMSSLRFADNEIVKGKFIGKTKEVIFLLNEDQVKVIPLTSLVKEIEIK